LVAVGVLAAAAAPAGATAYGSARINAVTPVFNGEITGKVTDSTGTPIKSVEVTVVGTKLLARTNDEGVYRLKNVPEGDRVLKFKRVGYQSKQEDVKVTSGTIELNIELPFAVRTFDEVIVSSGAGGTEAKSVPAAVTVVTAEDIEDRNYANFFDMFKGDVPGVFAQTNDYNAWTTISIRGASSMWGGSATIVMDGVRVEDQTILSTLDPRSIERVEILKGPQATTMYGGDPNSGGVIAITTKKGFYNSRRPMPEGTLDFQLIESKAGTGTTRRTSSTVLGGGKDWSYRVAANLNDQGEWLDRGYSHVKGADGTIRGSQKAFEAIMTFRYSTNRSGNPSFNALADNYPEFNTRDNESPYKSETFAKSQAMSLQVLFYPTEAWKNDFLVGWNRSGSEQYLTEPYSYYGAKANNAYSYFGSGTNVVLKSAYDLKITDFIKAQTNVGAEIVDSKNDGYGISVYCWTCDSVPSVDGTTYINPYEYTTYSYFSRYFSRSTGLYANEVLSIGDLSITAGIRSSQTKVLRRKPYDALVAPRLGLSYARPVGGADLKLFASIGKNPSPIPENALRDDADENGYWYYHANTALKEPALVGAEVGAELYLGSAVAFTASFYRQNAENQLGTTRTNDTLPEGYYYHYKWVNIGTMANTGMELTNTIKVGAIRVNSQLTTTHSRVSKVGKDFTGYYDLGDTPYGTAGVTGSVVANLNTRSTTASLGWNVTGGIKVFDEYHYNDYNAAWAAGEAQRVDWQDFYVKYPAMDRWRFTITQNFGRRLLGYATIENLFNSYKMQQQAYYLPKGRQTTIGFRIKP